MRLNVTSEQGSQPVIYLVSERFGQIGGGEAIKAYQYARYLLAQGRRIVVFTHERSVTSLGADLPPEMMRTVPDTPLQVLLWRSKLLTGLLQPYFHLAARRLVLKEAGTDRSPILHYISPVSPVAPRFSPGGFRRVFGPMTGNIYYPPGFRDRMSGKDRLREGMHRIAQQVLGRIFPEKRAAQSLLVSGYERTRASLEMAGCRPEQMRDVIDSGVNELIATRPRIRQAGRNPRFVASGRLVDYKGFDLAIRAVALAAPDITLDIYGKGEMQARLEALIAELGLGDRVRLHGWTPQEQLLEAFQDKRGYLFPTLAEANGMVMQEAMMMGLPVVTLRWGGPAMLADADSAVYLEPAGPEQVVAGLAAAIDRLAEDGEEAERLSVNARHLAETRFEWRAVAEAWERAYSGG
ncbi:MAG: glycosyltransferase family 4 protein [Thioclava marina]|uniref:glycosyltransferase family 4 protein n=1 Tax=Thioclava marina TaxID=1915077 RepID=UPI0019BD4522|nr:glycosyltransferase family 4 protein [Thioclava marina]MBC7146331.1 glycosyltransferase family 4 protein [Thioclava marina]